MKKILILLLFMAILTLNGVTLEECYQYLEGNYPTAKELKSLVDDYQLIKEQSTKDWLPTVDVTGGINWDAETMSMGNLEVPNTKSILEVGVKQKIYDGGFIKQDNKVNLYNNQLAQFSKRVEKHNLRELVNKFYFNVLLTEKKIAVAKLSRKSLLTTQNFISTQLKYGKISVTDSLLVANKLLEIDDQLQIFTQQKRSSVCSLNKLLKSRFKPSDTFIEPVQLDYASIEIRREELHIYSTKERLLKSQQSLITSKYLPKVSSYVKLTVGNPNYDLYNEEWNQNISIGANFSWNVWDWNREDYQKRLLKSQIARNSFSKHDFLTKVSLNVEEIKCKLTSTQKSQELIKKQITNSEKVVHIMEQSYELGKETMLNYTLNFNELHKLKLSLETVKLEYLYQQYKLQHTSGGR